MAMRLVSNRTPGPLPCMTFCSSQRSGAAAVAGAVGVGGGGGIGAAGTSDTTGVSPRAAATCPSARAAPRSRHDNMRHLGRSLDVAVGHQPYRPVLFPIFME